MRESRKVRIAWLLPFVPRAPYWLPVLAEFSRLFPRTAVFSCLPPDSIARPVGNPRITFVGRARYFILWNRDKSPKFVLIALPLRVFVRLVTLQPHVVFTSGFNVWSLVCLLLKPILGFKLVIVYDGSSPAVDARQKKLRLRFRRAVAGRSDALITNSGEGAAYLANVLRMAEEKVFRRLYLVPSKPALYASRGAPELSGLKRPIFLYVGRVSRLKGLDTLLEACAELVRRGRAAFSLVIVGGGREHENYRELARALDLGTAIRWAGWVEYGELGAYYRACDVFVFPSFTDVWGMAAIEAMSFSKSILCSNRAGVSELVVEGENGFLFDPERPGMLADLMDRFIADPSLAQRMGGRSGALFSNMNPASAAEGLRDVVKNLMNRGISRGHRS
jgi:glycosyltransferase involved in cell wall biosynthesis